MRRNEFAHDIEAMIKWKTAPASIDPQLGTIGRDVARETAQEREAGTHVGGLGASSYTRSGESHIGSFDGNFGVYTRGEDHRVLTPRRDLPVVAKGLR